MIISSTEGRTNAEEEPVAAASATFFSEFVRLSRKRKWNSIFAYLANMNLHFLSKQFYRNQFFQMQHFIDILKFCRPKLFP